ncbi:hypothetical protein PTI98_010074 [Pleurotus ostreatus]|nr:hypothetical protein PTI98_010074 [Pleurotus ostreatus]
MPGASSQIPPSEPVASGPDSDSLKLNIFLVQLKLYFNATPALASDEDKWKSQENELAF